MLHLEPCHLHCHKSHNQSELLLVAHLPCSFQPKPQQRKDCNSSFGNQISPKLSYNRVPSPNPNPQTPRQTRNPALQITTFQQMSTDGPHPEPHLTHRLHLSTYLPAPSIPSQNDPRTDRRWMIKPKYTPSVSPSIEPDHSLFAWLSKTNKITLKFSETSSPPCFEIAWSTWWDANASGNIKQYYNFHSFVTIHILQSLF
jgi:hypothetical protein